jgi:hypothetical protein
MVISVSNKAWGLYLLLQIQSCPYAALKQFVP